MDRIALLLAGDRFAAYTHPSVHGLFNTSSPVQQFIAVEARIHAVRDDIARLQHDLDSTLDYAVLTFDLVGRITSWNASARAILGCTDAEIIGRHGDVFLTEHDRSDEVFVQEMRRSVDLGRSSIERWQIKQDGARFWASGSTTPVRDEHGQTVGFLTVFRDDTARRVEEERQELRLSEMSHRAKNSMATVQAVVIQTLRGAGVPQAVQELLSDRLTALARAHDLVARNDEAEGELTALIEQELIAYGGPPRASAAGISVRLSRNVFEMLSLAFHELTTNAAKHGALSVPEGRVEIRWFLRDAEDGTRLIDIAWRELDGPPVSPPFRRGFGSRLLERGLVQGLGGTVKLDFRSAGLECLISFPIRPAGDK